MPAEASRDVSAFIRNGKSFKMRPEDLLSPTGPGPVEPRSVPQEDLAVKNNRQQIVPPRATVPTVQEERAHHYDGGDNGGDQRDGNANGKGDTGKKKRSQDKSRHKKKDNGFLTNEQKKAYLDKMRKRKDKGVGAAATANEERVSLSSSSSASASSSAAACVASPSAAARDLVPPSSSPTAAAGVAPPPPSTAATSVESPPSSATAAAAASVAPSAAVVTSVTGVSPPPSSETDVAPSPSPANPKKLTPMDTSEQLKVKDELMSTETDIMVMAVTKPSDDDNNCEIITISSDDSDIEEIPLQHTCAHRMQHTCQQYRNQDTNNMQLHHRPSDNSNIQHHHHHHHPQPQHQYHHHPHLPGGTVETGMWNPPGQMGVQQVHNHTVQPHDRQSVLSQQQIWPLPESQLQSQPQLQPQPQHQLEYQHQLQQHHQHHHQQQDLVTPQIVNVTSLQNSAIPSGAEQQYQDVQEDHNVSTRNIAQPHTCAQYTQQEQPCEQTTNDLPVTAPSSSSYEEDNMQSRVHTCQTEQRQEPEAMEQENHPRVSARQEELQEGGLKNQGKSEEELKAEALSRKWYIRMERKQMFYCKYCLQRFPDRHVWKRHRFLLCPVSKKRRPGHLENGEVAPAPKRIKLAASEALHRQLSRESTETEHEDMQHQKELRMEECGPSSSREEGVMKKKKKKKKMRLKDFILTVPIISEPNYASSDVPSASSAEEEIEPSTSRLNVAPEEKKKMRKKDFFLTRPSQLDSSDVPSISSAGEENEQSMSYGSDNSNPPVHHQSTDSKRKKVKKMRKSDFVVKEKGAAKKNSSDRKRHVSSSSNSNDAKRHKASADKPSSGNTKSTGQKPVSDDHAKSSEKSTKGQNLSSNNARNSHASSKKATNATAFENFLSAFDTATVKKAPKVAKKSTSKPSRKSVSKTSSSSKDSVLKTFSSSKDSVAKKLTSSSSASKTSTSSKDSKVKVSSSSSKIISKSSVSKAPKSSTKDSHFSASRSDVTHPASSGTGHKASTSKNSAKSKDKLMVKERSHAVIAQHSPSAKSPSSLEPNNIGNGGKNQPSRLPEETPSSSSASKSSGSKKLTPSGTIHPPSSKKSKDDSKTGEKTSASGTAVRQSSTNNLKELHTSNGSNKNRDEGEQNSQHSSKKATKSSDGDSRTNSGAKKLKGSSPSASTQEDQQTSRKWPGKSSTSSKHKYKKQGDQVNQQVASKQTVSQSKSSTAHDMPFGPRKPTSIGTSANKDADLSCSSSTEHPESPVARETSGPSKHTDKKQDDQTHQVASKDMVPTSCDTSATSLTEHPKSPAARETSTSPKHKDKKKDAQSHQVASKDTVPKSTSSSATPFGPRKRTCDTSASTDKDLSRPSSTEHPKSPKETSTSSKHKHSKQGDLTHKIASKETVPKSTSSATQPMPFGPRKKSATATPEKQSSSAKIQQKGEHRPPKKLTPIVQPKKLTPIPSANVISSNLKTKKNVVARPQSDIISSNKQAPSTPKKLTPAKCGHSGTSSHIENGGKPVTSHEATSSAVTSSPHAQANTKNPTEESSTSNLPVCPVTDTMTETESKDQSKDTTPGASDHSVMENTPAQTTNADTQGGDEGLPTKELCEGPSGENEGQKQVDDEREVFDRPSTSNSLPTVTKNDVYSYLDKVCAQKATSDVSVDSANVNAMSRTTSTATADGDAELHDGHLAAGPSGEHSSEQQMDDEQTIEQMNDDSGDSNVTASTSLPTVSKDDVYSYLGKVCAQYNIPQDSPAGSASNNQDSQLSNSQESSSINQEDEAGSPVQQVSAQTRIRPGTPTEDEHTQDSGAQTPQLQSSPMWQKVHSYIDNNGITRIRISRKSTESEAEVGGKRQSNVEEVADEEASQEQQENSGSGLASSNEAPAVGASVFNVKSKKKLANILERVKRKPSSGGQKNSKPDKETDPAKNRNATGSTSKQHGHEMVTAEDVSVGVPDGSKKSNERNTMSGSGEQSDERTRLSKNRSEGSESVPKPNGSNIGNLPTEGSENHGTVSDVADDLNMSGSSSLNISRVSSCSVSSEHQHDVDLNRMADDIDEEVFQQPCADERPNDTSPPDDARPGDDVLREHIKGTKSFLDSALRQWMPTLLESSAQPSAPRSSESTDRRKKEEFQKFKRMHLENMKKQKSPQKRTEAVDGATSRPSTSAGGPAPSQEKESNKGAASAKAREPEYYWCETCHHVFETVGAFYSSKHPCRFRNPTFKMMPKSKVDAQLETKRRLHQQHIERQRSNPTDQRLAGIQPVQRTNSMPAAVDGSVSRPSCISQDHRSRLERAFPDNRQRHSSGEGRHQGTPAMHVNRRRHSSEERRHHGPMGQTHSRDSRHPNHEGHHRARHNSSQGKDRSRHDRGHHTSSGHSTRSHKPTDRSRPQMNQDHPSRSGASSASIGYDIEAGDPMGLISLPSPAPAPPKEIRGPDSPINLIHVPSPAPCPPTNERESTAPEQNLVIAHPRPMQQQQQATPTSEPQAGDKQKEPEEVADTRKGNHPQNASAEDSPALTAPSETPATSSNCSSEIAAAGTTNSATVTSTGGSTTATSTPSPATAIEAATAAAAAFSSMSLAGLSDIEQAKAAMLELDRIKKALAKHVMDEERRQRLDGSSSSQDCTAQNNHTPHEDGASTSAAGLQDGSGNATENETSNDDKPEENWVQCDSCTKWRKLPPDVSIDEVMSAEKWFCNMNPDESHNRCEIPEESYDKDEECVYSDRGQRAEFGRLCRSPNMKRKGGKRKRGRQRKALPSALVASSHSITSTSEDAPSRVDTTSVSEVATCTSVSQVVSSAATTASTPIVSTNAGMPSTTTCTVASAMLASPCVSSQVVRTMTSAGVSSTLPRVSPEVIASGASQLVPTTSGTGASIPAKSTNTIGDSTHSALATPSPHVSPEMVTSGASQVVPLLPETAASIPATCTSTTAASTHATASSSLGSPQVIASVASKVVPTTSQTVSSVPATSNSSDAASTSSLSSRVSPQVIANDVTQVDPLTSLTRMTAASVPATSANTIAASTHPASATLSPVVSPQVIASVASQVDPITSVTRMTAASVPATSANTIAASTHVTLSLPPVPSLMTASGASNVSSSTLHSPPVVSVARASRGPQVPGVPIASTCTIAQGQVRRNVGASASRISPTNTTVPHVSQNAGIPGACTFPQGQMQQSNQTLRRNAGMHSTHHVAQRNPAAAPIHVPQQANPPPYPNHGVGHTRNVNYRQQIDARERAIEVQKKRIQDLINSCQDLPLDSTERFQRIYEANTMFFQFEQESQKLQQLRQLALQQECAQGMGQQYLHSPGSQSGQQNPAQLHQQNQQQQPPINTASNGHMMQASPSHLVPSNQQMPTNPIPVQSNPFYQQSTIPHQQQVTSQQQQLTSQQHQVTSQQHQVTLQQWQSTSQQQQLTLQQRQSTSQQQQLTLQQQQVVLQQQRYQQQQTQGLQRGRQLQTQAEAGQLQSQHWQQQQRHAFQLQQQQQVQTSNQMLRGRQGANPQPAQGTVQQSSQQYRVPEGGHQQRAQQPAQPYRIQQAVQQPVQRHRAQQNVNLQQSVQQISQQQRLHQPNQHRVAQQNINQQPSVQGQIAQNQRLHQPAQHHGVQQITNPQRSQEAQQQRHQETQSLHQQYQQQYQIYSAQQLNPTQNRSQPSPNQESSGLRELTEISPEESYLMNLYKHLDPKFEPFRGFLCKIRCKLFGTWAIGQPGASRADLSTFHEEYEYLQNIENRLSRAGHPTERLVCSIRVKLQEDHMRRIGSSNNEGQEQHATPHDVSNDAEEYWDSIVRDSAQDLVREAREAMSAEQNPATSEAQWESPKETERVDSTAPEVQTPTPEVQAPTQEVQTPTPEVQTPTPEVQTPIPEVQTPTPEVQTPTPEVQTPAPEVQTPIPEVQTPAPEAQDDFAQDASSAVRRAVLNQQTPGFRQPTPAPCRTPDTVTSQPSRDPSPAARQTPSPQETRNETLRLLKFCEQLIEVLGQKRMSPSVAARICIWKRRYIDIKSLFENQGLQSQPREEYVCWLMLQILAKEMRIMSLNNKIRARQIKLQNLTGPDADREREELQNIIGQKFRDEQRLKENQKYYDYLQNHPEVQNPFEAGVMPNLENVANRELRDEMIRSNPNLSNLLSGPLMTQSTFQGQSGSGSGSQGQPGADSRSQPGPGQSSNSSYTQVGPSGFGSSSQGQSDNRSGLHLQPSRESVSQAHSASGYSRIKQEPRDQEAPAPIQDPPQMAPVPVPTLGQSVSSTNRAQHAEPCNQAADQPYMPESRSNQSNVSVTASSRPGELANVQTGQEESMSRNVDNNASHVDNFVTKNHSSERSSCRFAQSHSTTNPDEGVSSIHDTEPSCSATSDGETTGALSDQSSGGATGVQSVVGTSAQSTSAASVVQDVAVTEQQMVQETNASAEQTQDDNYDHSENDQTSSISAVDKEVATAMTSNLPRYPEFSDVSDVDDRATPDNVSGTPTVSSATRPDEPTGVGTEQRGVMSRIIESLESYLETVVKKNDDLERSSCRFAQSQITPTPSADASSIHHAETSCPATSDGESNTALSDQSTSAATVMQGVAGTEQQMSQETDEQITSEQADLPSESDQATSSSAVDKEVATAMASNLPKYPEFSDISDVDDRATPDIVSETPAVFNEANSRPDGPATDQTRQSQSTTSPSADDSSVHAAETSASAICNADSNAAVRIESSSSTTDGAGVEQQVVQETDTSEEPATQDNIDIPQENDHETSRTTVESEVPNSGDVPSENNCAVSNEVEESEIPTTTTSNQSSFPENNNATSDIAVESEVPDTGDVSSKNNQTSSNGAAENKVASNVPGYPELSENNNVMSDTAVDNEVSDSGDVPPAENSQTSSNAAAENELPATANMPISPELSENNSLMSNTAGEGEEPDNNNVPSAENNQTLSNAAAENEVQTASSLNVPIFPEFSDISDVDDRATPDMPNSSATQNTLPTAVARRLSTAEYSPISDAADETDDELNNNQVDDAVPEEPATSAPSEEPIDGVSESPDADQLELESTSQQASLDFPVPPDAQTDARSEVFSDDVSEKPAGDRSQLASISQDPSPDHLVLPDVPIEGTATNAPSEVPNDDASEMPHVDQSQLASTLREPSLDHPVLPDVPTEEPATNDPVEMPSDDASEKPAGDHSQLASISLDPLGDHLLLPDVLTEETAIIAPSEVPSDDVSEVPAGDQSKLASTSSTSGESSLDHPVLPDMPTVKEELFSHNQIAVPRRTSIDIDALSDISDASSDLEKVAFLPSPEVSDNSNNRRVSSESNSNPTVNTSDETATPQATPAAGLNHQEPQWPELNLPILQRMISQPSPIVEEPQTHEANPLTAQNVIPRQASFQTNSTPGLSLLNVARTQQAAIALQPTKDSNLNVIHQQGPQTNSSHVQPGPSVSNVARTQNTAITLQPGKDLNLKQLNVVWAPNQWRKPSGLEHPVVSCEPVASDHRGSFSTVVSQSQQAPAMNVISVPSQQSRQLPLLRPAPHLQQRYPSGQSQDGSLTSVQLPQYVMPTTAITQAPVVNTNLPNSMPLPTLVAAPSIANLPNQVVGASGTSVLDARTSANVVEQNNLDSAVSGGASTSEPEQQLPIIVCVQSLNTDVMAEINQ